MKQPAALRSLAVRLSIFFALTSAAVFSILGLYLYSALEGLMTTRQQSSLENAAAIVRSAMVEMGAFDRVEAHTASLAERLRGNVRAGVAIYAADGRLLFSASRIEVPRREWEVLPVADALGVSSKSWQPTRQTAYRIGVTRFDSGKGETGYIVLALDVTEPAQLLDAFEWCLFAGIPAGMLGATLIGVAIARRELRPIVRIARAARELTASQLNERLDLADAPVELEELVTAFNTMLVRLEESFRRLSEFSADLAHEMRTPLTSLLGRTQLMLVHDRSAEEYRCALESSMEEIERLSGLVLDMLFLAQADSPTAALRREEVDLRRELDSLIEFFAIGCDERGITLHVEGEARIAGDRTMLRRALSNLLSNAIRHSADGSRVDVALACDPTEATVTISDRGAGIPPEHISRVFDRFYRADPSRTRDSGGTGLGLAIVKSIVTLHNGTVCVRSEPGKGTAFTLRLPCVSDRSCPPSKKPLALSVGTRPQETVSAS